MLTTEQYLLMFFLFILLLGLFLYVWLRRPPRPERLPPRPLVLPERLPAIQLKWNDEVPYHEQHTLEQQSLPWRRRMLLAGRMMKDGQVKQIYFLHGTFVGSDPFNVLPPLKNLMPQFANRWEELFEVKMKRAIDKLARDIGNFLPEYLELFHAATGSSIPCQTLHWSSANHHCARLQGALRLIEDVLNRFPEGSPGRILFIGHSHARQVFSLFTQLINVSELGENLWKLIGEEQMADPSLSEKARLLSHGYFDFVTLGGPLRYPFAPTDRMRFLNLVNHRGKSEQAEHLLSAWSTAGGDYIQQWGCSGSDALATTHKERAINRRLDEWLGKGMDTRVWIHTVASRQRVGEFGQTLLIDYGDQGGFRMNCLSTIFGHGIYTRYKLMLFQTELICRFLYS